MGLFHPMLVANSSFATLSALETAKNHVCCLHRLVLRNDNEHFQPMRAANSEFCGACSIPKAMQNYCLPPASAGNGQLRIRSIETKTVFYVGKQVHLVPRECQWHVNSFAFFPIFQGAEDPCRTNPCLNGATCFRGQGTTFYCNCAPAFTGDLCEQPSKYWQYFSQNPINRI